MYVEARQLRLVNIGQLIGVVANGVTIMGKLERVKLHTQDSQVTLRISGDSVCVPGEHQVNIKRSSELHELHLTSLGMDDLLESAGVGA